MSQLTTEQFLATARSQIPLYYHAERTDDVLRGIRQSMQECMGNVAWEQGLIKPQHLATLRAFYQQRSNELAVAGATQQANEMHLNGQIIRAIAKGKTAPVDAGVLKSMTRGTEARWVTRDYSTTVEAARPMGDPTLRERARTEPRTPKAIIEAASRAKITRTKARAATARPNAEAATPVHEPEPVAAITQPIIAEVRPLNDIKAEYDRCWGDVAKVCEGKLPLITLTGSSSSAPWWRMDHAPFQQQLEGARQTAHDMLHRMKAHKLDGLFDRIEALHTEKEQARAAGRSIA